MAVAAVLLEVAGHQRLDGGPVLRVEVAAGEEVLGQRACPVAGPGLEGGDEGALVDQSVLKREQSEQEMAVGGGGHGVVSIVVGRAGAGPGLRGRPRDPVASGRLSQVRHPFAFVPRGVVGQRLRRSESQGLDTNPARRDNVRGNLPHFNYKRDILCARSAARYEATSFAPTDLLGSETGLALEETEARVVARNVRSALISPADFPAHGTVR